MRRDAQLRQPQEDGDPLEEHVKTLVAAGRLPKGADQRPPFPDQVGYLYEWFSELNRARGYSDGHAAPIGWEGLKAWAQLTARRLDPCEAHGLMALDWVWRHPGELDEDQLAEEAAERNRKE